jgi:uridine kinase
MTSRRVSRAEAVAAATRVAAARPAQTLFVGVDGRAGSGKSTLAAAIADAVPGALVVPVDDFAGPLVPEWDWPRLREQVVDPLLAGRPGRYQRWEWNRDQPADWVDVPTGRLVLIEGVSATRSELAAPWELRIWVDAPRPVRLQRAVARDGQAMLSHWVDVWMPSEEAYIDRERPQDRADLIVFGTD